jgi:hypothetical protein
MKKRLVLEIGMGTDIRGADPTKAACIEGLQSKAEVLFRLQIQRDRLAQHSARHGVKFLDSLIQTVEKAQLQPAKPVGGRQLQLRDELLKDRGGQTSEANGEPPPHISAPQKPASVNRPWGLLSVARPFSLE